MSHVIRSIKVISKIFLLVVVLLFAWVFMNATNLAKGKKSLLGFNTAKADTPPGPDPGPDPIPY